MAIRAAATNTDLSESTWNSGGAIMKATVGLDTVVGRDYLAWTSGITQRLSGGNAIPHLVAVSTRDGCESIDVNNYVQMLASEFNTAGGSSISIINNVVGSASGAIKEKHTHVLGLEVHDDDEHAESVGTGTTTSSTFQNKVSLTFTPATEGDYLIWAECQGKHGSTATSLEIQLDFDSGTLRNLAQIEPASTSEWRPWSCVLGCIGTSVWSIDRLSAASHTFELQFRSVDNTTTASIRQARIYAIRLDTFKNFYYTENRARQTNGTTSYVTKLSHAPTIINSGNHLVFISAHLDGATGFNTDGRILIDPSGTPVTLLEPTVNTQLNNGNDDWSLAMCRMRNLSAGASSLNTWELAIKRAAAPFGLTGIEHAAICVIELAEAPTTKTTFLGRLAGMSDVVLATTSQ